jgi:phosphoserine phosphatase
MNGRKPLAGVLVASDVDGVIVNGDTIFSFFERYGKFAKAKTLNKRKPGSDITLVLVEIVRENKVTEETLAREAKLAKLYPGARQFYSGLEALGARVCLLTATYEPIAKGIAKRVGLKRPIIMATKVKSASGLLKGALGTAMEAGRKKSALRQACRRTGIPLSMTVGIGDSPSDRLFMDDIANSRGMCAWVKQPDFAKIKKQILRRFGEGKE